MKVMIVEDEIRIREGVVKLTQKISTENVTILCAENGREGLHMLEQEQIDLIITDICMPEMDGLEMLSIWKEKTGQLPKVIILSAYSDFEYARLALRLGIDDYVLKPVSVGEFTNTYRTLEQEIVREKEQKQEETTWLLDTILLKMLYYELPLEDKIKVELLEKYGLYVDMPCCFSLFYLGNDFAGKRKETVESLERLLGSYQEAKHYIWELPEEKMIGVLLFQYTSFAIVERWLQRQATMGILRKISSTKCIGMTEVSSLEQLKQSFKILLKYLEWSIVLGEEIIVSYPKVTKIQTIPVIYPIFLEQEIKEGLCAMNWDKVKERGRKFIEYFHQGALYDPEEIKKSFVKFIWTILGVIKEVDSKCYESFEQQKLLEQIMQAFTFSELSETLENLIEYVEKWQQEKENDDNLTIQRMKSMIHEFYNQGITLDEIAMALQMTPEYLGTQFHKEVGVTYSVYLKQYRIEKAKKLLLGTELKIYEVARQVGYLDSKYFSRVFKEIVGELPMDYKRRLKV